ncbi:glycosyl hydrolase family 76-domain-containing protein [Astrocystis sublimbata]|nr:glycosyl hydrolase family 76-domain-containing protein [Astrocystis sublimbata]
MARFSSLSLNQLLLSATSVAAAGLTVDVNDAASIKKAASVVAEDLMSFYTGEIPGILPGPPPDGDYYWWTGGALWATMLDYRIRTGDDQYDDKIREGISWQTGDKNDFLPANWTASEGNDDQAIWAMTALLAGETGFEKSKSKDAVEWPTLAQTVFEQQSERRVENGSCADALRWQIFPTNTGYNYVQTLANVANANIGARLSLLDRDNKTLTKSVEDTFKFLQDVKLIDSKFNVYDGVQLMECNSAGVNKIQSSYTAGLAIEAAAVLHNVTDVEKWKDLTDGLVKNTIDVFFPNGIATEVACEPSKCTTDFTFYKSVLLRSLASTTVVAPWTADVINPVLKSSAKAAAESCTGGKNGRLCGLVWDGKDDKKTGAGQQMSVLSSLLALLPAEAKSTGTGGSNNGSSSTNDPSGTSSPTPTPTDNAGASVGVSVALLGSVMLTGFMLN